MINAQDSGDTLMCVIKEDLLEDIICLTETLIKLSTL